MLYIDNLRKKKNLSIIASGNCNLRCAYCFLKNKECYGEEDEKIVKALDSGRLITNIENSLEKMLIPRDDFTTLNFWGGEPSLYLHKLSNYTEQILTDFKNIEEIGISTNMTTDISNFITYIESLESFGKPIEFRIQISTDGPDWIQEKSRGRISKKIHDNIDKLIEYFNSRKFNYVKCGIYYKTTISWDMLKEICSSYDNIIDYIGFFDKETNYFNNKIINSSFKILSDDNLSAGIVAPADYTQEDGVLIAHFARMFDAIDFKRKGLNYYYNTNLPIRMFLESYKHKDYLYESFCGAGFLSFMFRWDGSLAQCSQSFIEDRSEYLNYIKDDENLTHLAKLVADNYQYPNRDDILYPDIKKKLDLKEKFFESLIDFQKTIIIGYMYQLSESGQISSIYKNNLKLICKHAPLCLFATGCFHNNIKSTYNSFVPNIGTIKLLANGLLEYYYERGESVENE